MHIRANDSRNQIRSNNSNIFVKCSNFAMPGHAGGAVAYIEPAQYFDIKVVWIQGKELLSFTLSFSCLCAIVFVTSKKKRYSFFYLKHQTFFFLQNFSIWKNITFPYGNLSVEKKQKFARNN